MNVNLEKLRHDELVDRVKTLQEKLENKDLELDRIFKAICAECTDEMRRVLYPPKPRT